MKAAQPESLSPTFDFISYFEGERRVSGWFADRFGNLRRHFCGDFVGTVRDDGVLVLDERLIYNDGMIETRTWEVSVDENGRFHGESDSLVGSASGIQEGNGLNLQYVMNVQIDAERTWKLSMNDFMSLQPDGSLHNLVHVKKYGVRIGTISALYQRPSEAIPVDSSNDTCTAIGKDSDSITKLVNY